MKKKLLAVLLSALMIIGVTPLFASASYVDQGENYGYWLSADGQYRNLWNKYSATSKASHLGTNMKGYGEIARNSNSSPTYKEVYVETENPLSSGGIAPRRVTIKAAVSAAGININKQASNTTSVYATDYRTGSNLGTSWTMFLTSETLYTTSTVEYYRVNNF